MTATAPSITIDRPGRCLMRNGYHAYVLYLDGDGTVWGVARLPEIGIYESRSWQRNGRFAERHCRAHEFDIVKFVETLSESFE